MRRGLVLVAALLAAGCVTPGASQDASGDAASAIAFPGDPLGEHTPIASFDGTIIDAWVFRPAANDSKVPIIINFSPYWSNLAPPAATGGDAFSKYLIEYFVPRGYAVALVSARGTGLSEGCFTIGGPTELKDEDAVATFLAEQTWSNGNVTATGKSYDGTMAQGLLAMGNPHVRTIVPVSPISELYKYNFFDGVPYFFGGQTFNAYYVDAVSLRQSQDPQDATYEKTATRFCDESLDVQTAGLHSALTGDYGAYWQARNYTALLPAELSASVFYIHGLGDWNVKPDHMVPWIDELRARNVPVKMWLGAWEHEYPTRADLNETLLRWLDHELKGVANGVMDEPMVNVQDRDGVWRTQTEWPPARRATLTLHPTQGGKLAAEPGAGQATYPDRPAAVPGALPLPVQDVLVYESEPLAEDLRLAGAPTLRAVVSSTGPRATLSATLYRDGEAIDQGFLELSHRDSLAESKPMQPGQPYAVAVKFYPQDVLLPKGTVLRLVVSHTNPDDAPVAVLPTPTTALVTVIHGEGTALDLPVVKAIDDATETPQPEDVGCWAC